eukprot:2258794-Pyramimonas_sp.AAC.1
MSRLVRSGFSYALVLFRVEYSYDGPIRRRKRGYILMTDQSDAGSADSPEYRPCFAHPGLQPVVGALSPLGVFT